MQSIFEGKYVSVQSLLLHGLYPIVASVLSFLLPIGHYSIITNPLHFSKYLLLEFNTHQVFSRDLETFILEAWQPFEPQSAFFHCPKQFILFL